MNSNPDSAAPTGRRIPAQGKELSNAALGRASQNTSSPEGAKEDVELPKGWRVEKLANLTVKIGSGSTPRGGEVVYKSSGVPLIRSMNVHFSGFKPDGLVYLDELEAKKLEQVTVQKDDVLLNITGASIGRVTTAPEAFADARVNQHVCIIRPNVGLLSSFLAHFLASPDEQARVMSVQVGATRQALTKAMVQKWHVPLPPLSEQRRIVAEIEKQFTRLEAGVAALRRVQANLKRYRAAVLKAACEGRLVPTEAELARSKPSSKTGHPAYETGEVLLTRILTARCDNLDGRGKYEEPAVPNTAELPPLPESWAWATVEQLLRNDSGLGYGILKPGNEDPNGVPMLRVMDIGDGKLSGTEIVKVQPRLSADFNRTVLESGDILLAIMATVGRCTVVPEHLVGANVNRALAVIKPSGLVQSKFLELAIRSPRLKQLFQKNKIGSAQARINLSDLRNYCLPLPPLTEQTRIVAEVERRLSVVEELESVVSANLQRASRLRESILKSAFTGGVTSSKH